MREKGLVISNNEREYTCVRAQDSSVINLTLCSPTVIRKLINWKVMMDMESLSDHKYIIMELRGKNRNRIIE